MDDLLGLIASERRKGKKQELLSEMKGDYVKERRGRKQSIGRGT